MEIKEFIEKYLLNSKGLLNSNLFRNDYFKRKYPSEYAVIEASYPKYTDIRQKIYAHLRGDYHYCPGCGKICGYNYKVPKAYCSKECGAVHRAKHIQEAWDSKGETERASIAAKIKLSFKEKSEAEIKHIVEKRKQTLMSKYGVDHQSRVPAIREKTRKTLLKKYDVEYYSKTPEFLERIEATNIKRYGTKHRLQNKDELIKQSETMQEKYGVRYAMESEEIKTKHIISKWSKVFDTAGCQSYEDVKRAYIRHLGIEYEGSVDNILIGSPSYPRSKEVLMMFLGLAKPDIETVKRDIDNYWPYARALGLEIPHLKQSRQEDELYEFISSICKCSRHNRSVIAPKELDILVEDRNIAFEYNGEYWHSSCKVGSNYHKHKTDECEKKGIQLVHIWGWYWQNKQDIVKSIIVSKLGKSERVMARKCSVKFITVKEAREFFEKTHLKGFKGANLYIALEYNNEIVMVMSFSKHNEYEWELARMASKLNTTVVGGMSKLLSAFRKHTNAKQLMSYVDRDISIGKSYRACGFVELSRTRPSYWYVGLGEIVSRRALNNQSRTNAGFNGSEEEYAMKLGLLRIDNSGNIKMIKTF